MKRLNDAFAALINMVKSGQEFPSAHANCCLFFALTDKQAMRLTAMYDEYCAEGGAK